MPEVSKCLALPLGATLAECAAANLPGCATWFRAVLMSSLALATTTKFDPEQILRRH